MKDRLIDTLVAFAKGLCIGGTFSVPGVSGGAMAILLNIYDRMVFSLNSLLRKGPAREKLKCLLFLASAAVGGVLGFALFSRLIVYFLEAFPLPTLFLFAGTIGGGIPALVATSGIKRIRWYDPLFVVVGAALILLIAQIPEGLFSQTDRVTFGSVALQILGGVVLAFGLVLPGISFSQMLKVFGMYEWISKSLTTLDILPLIPVAVGGIVGVFLASFGIEKLLKRFPRQTYLVIFGFLVGSIPQMFEGVSFEGVGVVDCLLFVLLAAVGVALVAGMFWLEKRGKKKEK